MGNKVTKIIKGLPKKTAYNFDDKTGKVFNKLKVLKFHGFQVLQNGKKKSLWECECECGKMVIVRGNALSSGTTKSCGCHKSEVTRKFNRETKTKKVHDGFSYVWQSYKKGAKDRGFPFKLTKEEFRKLTQGECYYCGMPPKQQRKVVQAKGKMQGFVYNGVDRKDSKKGYVMSNCVSCCKTCNIAKGTKTQKEYLNHIEKIHRHLQKNKRI